MNEQEPPIPDKFASQRDEVLYLFSVSGWANESTGETPVPGRFVAKISNTEQELPELLDAFEDEVGRTGFTDTARLIGHFLLREDGQGIVHVSEYDSQLELDDAYSTATGEYTAWLARIEGQGDSLDTVQLHGHSLRYWHEQLTTNRQTGEPEGHLRVPCSRYGTDAEDCMWWTLAAECVYVEANGSNGEDDPLEALSFYAGLVVNDHPDIATLVSEYWYAVPKPLQDMLGSLEDVRRLRDDV